MKFTNQLHHLVQNKELSHLFSYLQNKQLFKLSQFYSIHEPIENIKDKVAIITGASSGIGRALAIELANKGAKVVIASRNINKLNQVKKIIETNKGNVLDIQTDVSSEMQCKKLILNTINYYGKIDILINNAGISMRANFMDVKLSVLQKLMNVNFWGTVYCTKYALPELIKSKGSLVGISSVSAFTPLPGRTGYVASKHAMDGFLETIRVENIPNKLHVLIAHPGFTSSNIRNVALNEIGLPQKETPKNESKLMASEKVANEIIKGIIDRKTNITLTTEGKLVSWLYKRIPTYTEKLIYREMKKEPDSPF